MVSERIRQSMASGSWIRKMFEEGALLKARYGEANVFDLSLGNPILEPPPEFKRELKKLINMPAPGLHRYMSNAGYLETRQAVAAHLGVTTGIPFTADNIIMTCGSAGALNVVLRALLNSEDEVIILAPFFAEYISYVGNYNGVVKIVPADENFWPKLDAIEMTISPRTRALIVNSPNNPSGVVYPKDLLDRLAGIIQKKAAEYGAQILLLSDEVYSRLVFDGLKCCSPLECYSQSIMTTSYSKDLSIPGERIGYIAIHPQCQNSRELTDAFIHCNRTLGFVNAPALMQHIVTHLQDVAVPANEYQRKRDFLYSNLCQMGYSVVKPQGAFYLFPKTPVADDLSFVRELQELRVLTVPGAGFGMPGYFRICYSVDDRTLEGSLAGFRRAVQKYRLTA